MKKFIKKCANCLYDLVFTTIDLVVIVLRSGVRDYRKYDEQSKPVRILANGPSLPDRFDAEETEYCMLNDSPKTEMFWNLKPSYYIVCDPLYFSQKLRDSEAKVYERLKDGLNWNLTVFVPYGYKKRAIQLFDGLNVNIIPFRGGVLKDIHSKNIKTYLYKRGLALPRVQNVMVGAIGCLIGVGFKEIELYGADHSWLSALVVNDDNVVCLSDSHYYEKNAKATPWYKVTGEPYKLHECLRDMANTFASYWDIKQYAESMKVSVVNKSKGSFIDAFKKK